MDKKLLLSIGLLFIVLITQYANAVPLDDKEDPDYPADGELNYDDDYNDDTKEDDKTRASTVQTEASTASEVFTKVSSYDEEVDIGKNVKLVCKGDVDENAVVMWYNDTTLIYSGTFVANSKIKFSKKDGSLTIEKVDIYDQAKFRCRAFHNKERYETVIDLHVRGPPQRLSIGHNREQKILANDESLTYKAGEKDLRFKCIVGNARPAAKFTWIHNGNAIQEQKDRDIKFVEDNILEIKVLHARHAGQYECEATNEYGSAKINFNIDVQYAPFFRPHHSYFNAEIGYDVEIFCTYKASPAATSVKWFKDGEQIHESVKYVIKADMKDNHDRTKLLIKDVQDSDLTTYQCEVQNTLGIKKESITVGSAPSPPKFEGYKYINNVLYTDWLVKSHQELQNMIVLYRNNENAWSQSEAKITNQNKVRDGEWKVQGTLSLEAGEWTIKGRARNNNGWSDDNIAQNTNIKIPKDSTESAEMTSSASSIASTICGSLIAFLISRYFV